MKSSARVATRLLSARLAVSNPILPGFVFGCQKSSLQPVPFAVQVLERVEAGGRDAAAEIDRVPPERDSVDGGARVG
jgi:hypothetical protein